MFTRRSRKGRIHVVRERVHKGYRRLSDGLGEANRNVQGGIWQIHKGMQLGLAKGHQAIQSGLKGVQDITGDFNENTSKNTIFKLSKELGMSYYQYEPPVAMFSMAEVDKYNRYEGSGMALFADPKRSGRNIRVRAPKAVAPAPSQMAKDWGRVTGAVGGAYNNASGGGGVYGVARNAAKGVLGVGKGAYGIAHGGAALLGKGASMAVGGAGNALLAGGTIGGGLAKMAGEGLLSRPGRTGAILGGLAAAGAGGAYFLRRRRSKNGKIIVEQVRR